LLAKGPLMLATVMDGMEPIIFWWMSPIQGGRMDC
jgi:hypothetical protein